MDALQRVRPSTTLPPSDLIALNPRLEQQAAGSLHPARGRGQKQAELSFRQACEPGRVPSRKLLSHFKHPIPRSLCRSISVMPPLWCSTSFPRTSWDSEFKPIAAQYRTWDRDKFFFQGIFPRKAPDRGRGFQIGTVWSVVEHVDRGRHQGHSSLHYLCPQR